MKKGHLLVALQFSLLVALAISPQANTAKFQRWCGTVLFLTGLVGISIAMRQLGKALTPLPESKEGASLVTHGLYKVVRHPIYSFLLLIALGVILYKGSSVSFVLFGLLFLILWYKYHYEDEFLRSKWTEADHYQKSVPALFPRLRWRL